MLRTVMSVVEFCVMLLLFVLELVLELLACEKLDENEDEVPSE
jgi:hypothetical protein